MTSPAIADVTIFVCASHEMNGSLCDHACTTLCASTGMVSLPPDSPKTSDASGKMLLTKDSLPKSPFRSESSVAALMTDCTASVSGGIAPVFSATAQSISADAMARLGSSLSCQCFFGVFTHSMSGLLAASSVRLGRTRSSVCFVSFIAKSPAFPAHRMPGKAGV